MSRRFHAVLATIRVDALEPGALVCCVEHTVRFAGAGRTDSIVYDHFNRPTKRGKENSRSDGHCQCEKEMEDFAGVSINI
jgi:hypothetical protein